MILLAPDKFKGTFTASEVCSIIEGYFREGGYRGRVVHCPMSDGGEGIAGVLMPGASRLAEGVYENPDDGSRLVVSSEIVGFSNFDCKGLPLMQLSSIMLGKAIAPGIPTTVAIGGTAVSDGGAVFLQ